MTLTSAAGLFASDWPPGQVQISAGGSEPALKPERGGPEPRGRLAGGWLSIFFAH
jgi:hypothetical protein